MGQNLPKKSISGLKQKNRTFTCVRDRYYIKLSHNGILISLLFQVAKTNSFKEKLNLNWNWIILEKLYLEKAFKRTYRIFSSKHREWLFNLVDLRCSAYWRAPLKKRRRLSQNKTRKATSFKYLRLNCCNKEAVAQRCSVKKVFLEISQNSQENTCARVSFSIKFQAAPATLLKKRVWYRCFPVNFAKFLINFFYRTPLGDCFYNIIQVIWKYKVSASVSRILTCYLLAFIKNIEYIKPPLLPLIFSWEVYKSFLKQLF